MKLKFSLAVLLLAAGVVLAAGHKGTVPRADASRYAAHAAQDGATIGAELLSAERVKRAFVSEVNNCCLVVEVAVYPEKGSSLEIALDDFTLRVPGTGIAAKPSSARLVVAALQKSTASRRDITVSPSVGIGYESGGPVYDPATGRTRGGGVYTSAGVGVGVGDSRPVASERDRDTMEMELGEKGLPEGTASEPVAGHLYFQMAPKKKGSAGYELEYKLNGQKVTLRLRP